MNLSTITGPTVQDYFTSDNSPTETEGQNDDDLGSGGAAALAHPQRRPKGIRMRSR